VNLFERSAGLVEVEFVVAVAIDDNTVDTQSLVYFHSPIPTVGVRLTQKQPFSV
jgi:hypothetical protein